MATPVPVRVYEGVPTTSEAALFTAKAKTVVTSVVVSGDATGGTVSLSLVPKGGTAGVTNRFAQLYAVAAAACVNVLPTGTRLVLNTGDFLSGLQSSGTHLTLIISGDSLGEA